MRSFTILQGELYISREIMEPVRVLKGHQVLSDDSTLKEHGITDGSTINILIDPEECISVFVQCGPKVITKEISNTMTVTDLKTDLVKSHQVAWQLHQFELGKVVARDDGVGDGVIIALDDDDVPLHYYGIHTETNLTVVASFFMINILNVNGEYLYKRVPRQMTVRELKVDILHSRRIYTKFDYHDVMMFIKTGNDTYTELDPRVQRFVGEALGEGDTLYLSADTFFKEHYPLYYNGSEAGKVGVVYQQSVFNVRLGTQVQTGVPVSNIRVLHNRPPKRLPSVTQEVNPNFNAENTYINGNSRPVGVLGTSFSGSINPLQDNIRLYGHSKHFIEIF